MSVEALVEFLVEHDVPSQAISRALQLAREAYEKPTPRSTVRSRKRRALARGDFWDEATETVIPREEAVARNVACNAAPSPPSPEKDQKTLSPLTPQNIKKPPSASASQLISVEEFEPTARNVETAQKYKRCSEEYDSILDMLRAHLCTAQMTPSRFEGEFNKFLINGRLKGADKPWEKTTKTAATSGGARGKPFLVTTPSTPAERPDVKTPPGMLTGSTAKKGAFFAIYGSYQWDCWNKYLKATGRRGLPVVRHHEAAGVEGYYVDAPYPPDFKAEKASEKAAKEAARRPILTLVKETMAALTANNPTGNEHMPRDNA